MNATCKPSNPKGVRREPNKPPHSFDVIRTWHDFDRLSGRACILFNSGKQNLWRRFAELLLCNIVYPDRAANVELPFGRCAPMKRATAADKQRFERIAAMPCLVCGAPATLHHVTGFADRMGRAPRRHDRVVPLCPMHHQAVHDPFAKAPVSVERLGHRGFYQEHGIDLMAVAERLADG